MIRVFALLLVPWLFSPALTRSPIKMIVFNGSKNLTVTQKLKRRNRW